MRAEAGLAARSAPGHRPTRTNDPAVDRAEGGGGESGKHARVRSQRFGHSLAPGQPGPDELVGVSPVGLGARRAHRRAAVAARDVDRLVRQILGVHAVDDLTGGGIHVSHGAAQPDGSNAATGTQGSGQPPVIVVPASTLEHLDADAPGVSAGPGPVVYQDRGKSQHRRGHARTHVGRQFGIGGHVEASPLVVDWIGRELRGGRGARSASGRDAVLRQRRRRRSRSLGVRSSAEPRTGNAGCLAAGCRR